MARFIFYILLFLIIGNQSIMCQVDLSKDLMGKYCLDGDAVDLSKNALNGTIFNATPVSDRFNNPNAALSFNGTSAYVLIPIDSFKNPTYTYSLWFYIVAPPSNNTSRQIIAVGGDQTDQLINISNNYFGVYNGVNVGGYHSGGTYNATNNLTPPINQWNHVASVKTLDSIKMFLNGKLVASSYAPQTPMYTGNAQGLRLAGRANHNQYFSGRLDDVWIYKRPLSDEEISAIYNFTGQFQLTNAPDTFTCAGQPITISALDDEATYLWSTGERTKSITVSQPGTYWVDVNLQCVSRRDTIIVRSKGIADLPSIHSFCLSDSVLLNLTNIRGTIDQWSTGETASSIYVKDTGTYWVRITEDGCTNTLTTRVVPQHQTPEITANSPLCRGNTINLDAGTNEGVLSWSTLASSRVITISSEGLYWVDKTLNNCTLRDTIIVTEVKVPSESYLNDTIICSGSSINVNLQINGFSNITWNDGDNSSIRSLSNAGLYWYDFDFGSCRFRDSLLLSLRTPSDVGAPEDTTLCEGQSLVVDLNYPFLSNVQWNDGSTQLLRQFDTSGSYSFTFTENGCVFQQNINLQIVPSPDVKPSLDSLICDLTPFIVDYRSSDPTVRYLWDNGDTSASQFVAAPSTRTINIISACGIITRTIKLELDDCFGYYPPSSFTPNGDGLNDNFSLGLRNATRFSIKIFDRWGEKVYQSENPLFVWDGKFRGEALPTGVYLCLIQFVDYKGRIQAYEHLLHIIK